jgi:hypothetical protein
MNAQILRYTNKIFSATCYTTTATFPSVVCFRPWLVTPFSGASAMPDERTEEQVEVCGASQALENCQRTVSPYGNFRLKVNEK